MSPERTLESNPLEALAGRRALVVASSGGHLNQAVKWMDRLQLDAASLVVTFDLPQSRALLAHRSVMYVGYVRSRDWRAVLSVARELWRLVPARRPEVIVTTGAALALSVWPVARRLGLRIHYIESVSRFAGPSLTGRIMRRLAGVDTWSQHDYAQPGWQRVPSLLGLYTVEDVPGASRTERPLRILVTLGTIRPYRFDRLIDEVLTSLRDGDEVTWQVGCTTRTDLPGRVVEAISDDEMHRLLEGADVVIAHGGVGTALDALARGKTPVMFARRALDGEHVDDHQEQIVGHLSDLGLAERGDGRLDRATLLAVTTRRVVETR
ncbi:glycosyltransferase [Pseudolysinimonas sp.]|jgi:UDP-N-acetylglucosamine--N-acetylmuramyl-(pentapeptide) pyrophosphoryl-undecaprenol N-acetylglucosamine transferase|uniref:glycosyltransferase n=1 Tax=Pseudolysinimonas sp. TaxID=2680009 RepID=UPI003783F528